MHLQKFTTYAEALNNKNRLANEDWILSENVIIHKDDSLHLRLHCDPSKDGLFIVGSPMGTKEYIEKFMKEKNAGFNV